MAIHRAPVLRQNEEDLLHALVNDRVASSLADDKISPLNDDDRHEERRVTRVLQSLALSVRLQHTYTRYHSASILETLHVFKDLV